MQSTAENRERNIDGTGNHALYDFLPFTDIDNVCILIKRGVRNKRNGIRYGRIIPGKDSASLAEIPRKSEQLHPNPSVCRLFSAT